MSSRSACDQPPGNGDRTAPSDGAVPVLLDIDRAVVLMGGNRDFYTKIAGRFCVDGRLQLQAMQQHVQDRQWGDAIRSAHTLKGLTGTVGADALAALMRRIEQLLKGIVADASGQDLDCVRRMESDLVAHLLEAVALFDRTHEQMKIDVPLDSRTNAGGLVPAQATGASFGASNDADRATLAAALNELQDLLRRRNMRALTLLKEIQHAHAGLLGASAAALDAAISQLDFDAASAELAALLRGAEGQSCP